MPTARRKKISTSLQMMALAAATKRSKYAMDQLFGSTGFRLQADVKRNSESKGIYPIYENRWALQKGLCLFQCANVKLSHFKHGLHHAPGFFSIHIRKQFTQYAWNDLP